MPPFKAIESSNHALWESLASLPEMPQLLIHEFEHAGPKQYAQLEKIKKIDMPVLLIMGVLEKASIQRLIDLGVEGIITKQCSKEEIVTAIDTTVKRERFFCGKVLSLLFDQKNKGYSVAQPKINVLSPREKEVLSLITKGHTTQRIAEILHLSVHTINSHRKSILKKFNLKSPVELIVYALENNLVDKD